jgi:glycosyltransferase involved in cell wall biosynthesis
MSDLNPLVSCISVTYGRFSLLQEMYWCWLSQNYQNKELIIVNDQADLTITCKNPNVKIFNLKDRFDTLGAKRNFSLEQISADAKYVIAFDDDDLSFPNHISSLVAGFSTGSFSKVVNKKHFITKDNKFLNYNFFFPYFCASLFDKNFILEHKFLESNTHEADELVRISSKNTCTITTPPTFIHRFGLGIVHALAGNRKISSDEIYKLIAINKEPLSGSIELEPIIKPQSLKSLNELKLL